jgi:two-component system NtrC family sensor kinase
VENKDLLWNLIKGLAQQEDVAYIMIQDREENILAELESQRIPPSSAGEKESVISEAFEDEGLFTKYYEVEKGSGFCNFSYPIYTTKVARSKEELGIIFDDQGGFGTKEKIGMAHVRMSLANMHKEIASMKNMIVLLTTLVVAIGVLLTIFLVNIIVKPVQKLVFATQRVADGDLSQVVEVKRRDEIGLLAYAFNRMTNSLKESREKIEEYNRTLEKRVRERTMDMENALKDLKQAQAQLIQAGKMAAVGELAAGVAHELNNPLSGILGYCQFALEKITQKPLKELTGEDISTYSQYLKDIELQSKRCKAIIQSLLKFSRASVKGDFKPTDVNSVLKETFTFVKHQLEKHKVSLEEELTPSLPPITGNISQLQQVFTNLILNAIQAMPDGGKLTVLTKVSEDKKSLDISFADTGKGISKENLSKIFEPFFTTKKVGQGTGLGLSVSYGIIKDHKGEIIVESEIGKGTTFIITIPVARLAMDSQSGLKKDEYVQSKI